MKYVVDVNNVLRITDDEVHPCYLKILLESLKSLPNADVVCIADANVDFLVKEKCVESEQELFQSLKFEMGKRFSIVPGGSRADEFILQFADACNADVISNDRFRDYAKDYTWIVSGRRLHKLAVVCGVLMVPSLGLRAGVSNEMDVASEGHLPEFDYDAFMDQQKKEAMEYEKLRNDLIREYSKAQTEELSKAQSSIGTDVNLPKEQKESQDIPGWKVALGVGVLALAAWVGWEFREEISTIANAEK